MFLVDMHRQGLDPRYRTVSRRRDRYPALAVPNGFIALVSSKELTGAVFAIIESIGIRDRLASRATTPRVHHFGLHSDKTLSLRIFLLVQMDGHRQQQCTNQPGAYCNGKG